MTWVSDGMLSILSGCHPLMLRFYCVATEKQVMNTAAGSVHTRRQGRARARWAVDLRTGPRSRLTNPTCLNYKRQDKKKGYVCKVSWCDSARACANFTTLTSRGSPPPPSHCPGPGYPGAPGWGRRGPGRSRSRAAAPAGWAARGPRARRSPGATRESWGRRSTPPCPWPCRSSARPSAGWRPASAWRRCTLPPPRGQSNLSHRKKGLLD